MIPITQRAHGLLAAQIASYWKFTYPHNRRLDTILAIAEHDDTGVEFDQQHLLTLAGGPVHYAMRGFDAGHCRQPGVSAAQVPIFQHFQATEINATFYRLPSKSAVARWMETVPKEFRFCPKISRFITHAKKLNDPGQRAVAGADAIMTLA